MKKTFLLFFIGSAFIFPSVSFAYTTIGSTLDMFLETTLSLINIFGTLAFVVFFYGLAMFLLNTEDKKANETGKNVMVWGIVGLFVLVTIWGIIGFMQDSLGVGGNGPLDSASGGLMNSGMGAGIDCAGSGGRCWGSCDGDYHQVNKKCSSAGDVCCVPD